MPDLRSPSTVWAFHNMEEGGIRVLYMIVNTHNPEGCAFRGEEA